MSESELGLEPERERDTTTAGAGGDNDAGDAGGVGGGFDERAGLAAAVRNLGAACAESAFALGQLRPEIFEAYEEADALAKFEEIAQAIEASELEPLRAVGLLGAQGTAKLSGLGAAHEDLMGSFVATELVTAHAEARIRGLRRILRAMRWGSGYWGSVKAALVTIFPNLEGAFELLSEMMDLISNAAEDEIEAIENPS